MADKPYTSAEVEAAVKLLREDAVIAHNRAVVQRLDAMEQRMQRMPVQEMTAEEKAAAYDKLMSGSGPGGGAPPGTPPGSPAPAPGGGPAPAAGGPAAGPPAPPPAQERKRSAAEGDGERTWWGIYQSEGGK